jgi:hypothetical protein
MSSCARRLHGNRFGIPAKLESAWQTYHKVKTGEYLASLQGTIGLQPLGT